MKNRNRVVISRLDWEKFLSMLGRFPAQEHAQGVSYWVGKGTEEGYGTFVDLRPNNRGVVNIDLFVHAPEHKAWSKRIPGELIQGNSLQTIINLVSRECPDEVIEAMNKTLPNYTHMVQ